MINNHTNDDNYYYHYYMKARFVETLLAFLDGRHDNKIHLNVLQRTDIRTVLDLPKPKYCGAPNLCEDLYYYYYY